MVKHVETRPSTVVSPTTTAAAAERNYRVRSRRVMSCNLGPIREACRCNQGGFKCHGGGGLKCIRPGVEKS